jgi:uncharacterized protein YdeI (YjbR/CyaY-like superfamily)
MKPTFFETPAAFRQWLSANHETARELVVGFFKRHTLRASITWPESVDEALCFGWIDGVRKSLSVDAYTIRFTPRKPTSTWSAVNVDRVKELTALGKMAPAGLRAFATRTAERTGRYSYERIEVAKLTLEQQKQLDANKKAKAFLEAQPPWYRRAVMHWVSSAKREETRARRLSQLIEDSAAGRPVPPLVRPTGAAGGGAARVKKEARRARHTTLRWLPPLFGKRTRDE